MKPEPILIALAIAFLLFGCARPADAKPATGSCVAACRQALAFGRNLSDGPCLLNPIPNTRWVCDVAHSPRQRVDDLPQNQCSTFGQNGVNRFVEVTPGCEFIQTN